MEWVTKMADPILQALQAVNQGQSAIMPNYNSPYHQGYNDYQGSVDTNTPYYGGAWQPSDWGQNVTFPSTDTPFQYNSIQGDDPFMQALIDLQNSISFERGFQNDQFPTRGYFGTNWDYWRNGGWNKQPFGVRQAPSGSVQDSRFNYRGPRLPPPLYFDKNGPVQDPRSNPNYGGGYQPF